MALLLRFNGAVRHDPAIDAWLESRPTSLGAIARHWFTRVRRAGAGVRELMHDGCPTACVGDAGLAYVNVFSHHVNVGFFQGASLPDPAGLLEGTGKFMRHVKLRPGMPVDEAALQALIKAAHADITAKLGAQARAEGHLAASRSPPAERSAPQGSAKSNTKRFSNRSASSK